MSFCHLLLYCTDCIKCVLFKTVSFSFLSYGSLSFDNFMQDAEVVDVDFQLNYTSEQYMKKISHGFQASRQINKHIVMETSAL